MFSSLKAFDAFPKVNEDFYARSVSGGVITLGASLIMAALFFNELGGILWLQPQQSVSATDVPAQAGIYVTTQTVNELSVDLSRGDSLAIHVRSRPLQCGCY